MKLYKGFFHSAKIRPKPLSPKGGNIKDKSEDYDLRKADSNIDE